MTGILEKITVFAGEAHGTQQRKYTPEAYIAHPIRVMETCREYTQDLPLLAAALLHDVLEDTSVKPPELQSFLETVMKRGESSETMKIVTELTDIFTKGAWPRLNRRNRKKREADRLSKVSASAQTIKYADIIDNARAISSQDADFGAVYLRECAHLLRVMERGNPALRTKAIEVVEEELALMKKG